MRFATSCLLFQYLWIWVGPKLYKHYTFHISKQCGTKFIPSHQHNEGAGGCNGGNPNAAIRRLDADRNEGISNTVLPRSTNNLPHKKKTGYDNLPNNEKNATYCSLWRWIGISFAISWWIIGKNGGQFFSSITIPAAKQSD